MSEKEIIKNAKEMIDNAECWIDDEEYSEAEEREWAKFEKETIEGLLDLYEKEKENYKEMCKLYYDLGSNYCDLDEKCKKQQKEIDFLQTKIKQNGNMEKIKMCMTHNMPNNAEIVCMVREDFERNFGNDYISKDKIREIKKDLEDFDTKFYSSEQLKLAVKNSLKELLGE